MMYDGWDAQLVSKRISSKQFHADWSEPVFRTSLPVPCFLLSFHRTGQTALPARFLLSVL